MGACEGLPSQVPRNFITNFGVTPSLVLTSMGLGPEELKPYRGRTWIVVLDAMVVSLKTKTSTRSCCGVLGGGLTGGYTQDSVDYLEQARHDVARLGDYIYTPKRVFLAFVGLDACVLLEPPAVVEQGVNDYWALLMHMLARARDHDAFMEDLRGFGNRIAQESIVAPIKALERCDALFACGGDPFGIDVKQEFWQKLKGRVHNKTITYFGRSAGSIWAGERIHSKSRKTETKEGLGLLQQVVFPHIGTGENLALMTETEARGGKMLKLRDGEVYVDDMEAYRGKRVIEKYQGGKVVLLEEKDS